MNFSRGAGDFRTALNAPSGWSARDRAILTRLPASRPRTPHPMKRIVMPPKFLLLAHHDKFQCGPSFNFASGFGAIAEASPRHQLLPNAAIARLPRRLIAVAARRMGPRHSLTSGSLRASGDRKMWTNYAKPPVSAGGFLSWIERAIGRLRPARNEILRLDRASISLA